MFAGTSNRVTMGNPGEAVPMFKFNSMPVVELGRAMHRQKDSAQLFIDPYCR
jgi:hypothetical protein